MEASSKSKLTGGTLFFIALIVLIFGNAQSVNISKQVEKANASLSRIESQIGSLKREVIALKKENENLKDECQKSE